ncbi:MAG: hypothetical protein WC569_00785 [Candidatus Omnitrophota bacterium]
MIKRIILISHSRFTARDHERFGVETLSRNGFRVEVWDISSIIYPELAGSHRSFDLSDYGGLVMFDDKKKARSALAALSREDFVVTSLSYNSKGLWFYRALSRSKAGYAVRYVNAVPFFRGKNKAADAFRKIKGLRRARTWKDLLMKLPPWSLGVRPAGLFICGGEKWGEYRRYYRYPVGKDADILPAHALDYDLYLDERHSGGAGERPMAVFLDEYVPFHPDQKICGGGHFVNADRYYMLLNGFFDAVEKNTGLSVVIAAHPRSCYEDKGDYFKGRSVLKGRTIQLIKESRLVLSHCSTALNFANLFYKPVVFMTCSELSKIHGDKNDYIGKFAALFGKRPVAIDDYDGEVDWREELKIDREMYDRYRRHYIKTADSQDLPCAQILADKLKSYR